MIEGYNVNIMDSPPGGLPAGPGNHRSPPIPREPYRSYEPFRGNSGPFATIECNDGTAVSLRLDCIVSMAYSDQHQTLRIYSSMGSEIVLSGRNLKALHNEFTDERVKVVHQFSKEIHEEPGPDDTVVLGVAKG